MLPVSSSTCRLVLALTSDVEQSPGIQPGMLGVKLRSRRCERYVTSSRRSALVPAGGEREGEEGKGEDGGEEGMGERERAAARPGRLREMRR